MWKKILLILVAVGILGGLYGYKEWNRKAESMSTRKVDVVMTAEELANQYNDTYHLGKVVEVTGKIASFNQDGGKKNVLLDTNDPLVSIVCEMDSTVQKLPAHEGATTTIRGQCDGKLTDIQLSRCVIIH